MSRSRRAGPDRSAKRLREEQIDFGDGSVFVGETAAGEPHRGSLIMTDDDGEEVCCWTGAFVNGVLEGEGREKTNEYEFVGSFAGGVKHGAGKMTFHPCGLTIDGRWSEGALHGEGCTVIFPDQQLRIECRFERGEFVSGTTADGRRWEAQGDFPGQRPTQSDPYEERYVEERRSTVVGAGQGLFARRALPAGLLACYYNGLLVEHAVVDSRSWRFNANTISLDEDFCLDVPLSHTRSRAYSATLGHKVNSSRQLCNCEYVRAFHPFWGSIKAVRTTRPVAKGEELFTFYDYKNERRPPSWFQE